MKRNCLEVFHRLQQDAIRNHSPSRVRLAIRAHRRKSPYLVVFEARIQRPKSQVSLILLDSRRHGSAEFTAAVDSPTQAP